MVLKKFCAVTFFHIAKSEIPKNLLHSKMVVRGMDTIPVLESAFALFSVITYRMRTTAIDFLLDVGEWGKTM